MYCLFDTFNDKIVSRHRTVEAAQRADDKLQNSLRGNSYLPTGIREIVKGKAVVIKVTEQDADEWEDEIVNAVLCFDLSEPVEVRDAVLAVARAGGDWQAELARNLSENNLMPLASCIRYAINTTTTEYTTTSAASAARVFLAKQRNGQEPAAYAIVDAGKGVSVRDVALSGNVTLIAKLLIAAAR